MNRTLRPQSLLLLSFLFLTAAFFPACASSKPRPVGSYSSVLRLSNSEQRQVAKMSNEELDDRPSGNIKKESSARSQTTAKRGKIKKHESEVTELVETDISTVIQTTSSPTADKDLK